MLSHLAPDEDIRVAAEGVRQAVGGKGIMVAAQIRKLYRVSQKVFRIFTCGFQDAGLGTVGSLLNLLLLTNEFRKANRAKLSTPKGGRKGLLTMTRPLVRSDLASEAILSPKQP